MISTYIKRSQADLKQLKINITFRHLPNLPLSFIPLVALSPRNLTIKGVQRDLDWFGSSWVQTKGQPSAVKER